MAIHLQDMYIITMSLKILSITVTSDQPADSSERLPAGTSSHGNAVSHPQTTPPEATPSGGGAEGGASLAQPFQAEFIKRMIQDALDDFREQIRDDILNLHVDMIKQFQMHQVWSKLL